MPCSGPSIRRSMICPVCVRRAGGPYKQAERDGKPIVSHLFCDCRKSGFAAFSRRLRFALRLGCPLTADHSTLTPRKVFSAAHRSRQKTDFIAFTSADVKLREAFSTSRGTGELPFLFAGISKNVNIFKENIEFYLFFTKKGIERMLH